MSTKLEDYQAKAAASLAATEAAATDRERAFHARAHGIYRRLIDNLDAAEVRAEAKPAKKAH